MINAIIFDLWSTLGGKHTSVSRRLFHRFGIEKNRTTTVRYERSVQLRAWKKKQSMARSFLKEFRQPATQDNIRFVIKAFDHGVDCARPFPGIRSLIKSLHRRYKLGILSNTTVFESSVPAKWGLTPLFDSIVWSWMVGSIKPSQKNFRFAAKSLGVSLKECLFVDDNIYNVQAAQKLGMKAIQFQNIAQLKRELKSMKLKW